MTKRKRRKKRNWLQKTKKSSKNNKLGRNLIKLKKKSF